MLAVRLDPEAVAVLDEVAAVEDVTRSWVFRRMLSLGLAAWRAGVRDPQEVAKRLG